MNGIPSALAESTEPPRSGAGVYSRGCTSGVSEALSGAFAAFGAAR